MRPYKLNLIGWCVMIALAMILFGALLIAIKAQSVLAFDPTCAESPAGVSACGSPDLIEASWLPTESGNSGSCPQSAMFWSHVYNPSRLAIQAKCVTVTGTIVDATDGKRRDGVRHEADGDCHGWVRLDSGQAKYLNAGNKSNEGGNLVFENVCFEILK